MTAKIAHLPVGSRHDLGIWAIFARGGQRAGGIDVAYPQASLADADIARPDSGGADDFAIRHDDYNILDVGRCIDMGIVRGYRSRSALRDTEDIVDRRQQVVPLVVMGGA